MCVWEGGRAIIAVWAFWQHQGKATTLHAPLLERSLDTWGWGTWGESCSNMFSSFMASYNHAKTCDCHISN